VYWTRALKAQCSVVESQFMAQAGQLNSWASVMGHVIGPSVDNKTHFGIIEVTFYT